MAADSVERIANALADRYTIERELGAGGMATVYLAHDAKHERKVAIKVFRPELAAVLGAERFLNEIKVTANLQHPHILTLHDSGEADGFLFYVMPYVEGESLREKLEREKQLVIDEALEIAKGVASALDYAHRHEVVHRDIKPENILLHDGQPVVADFGIALAVTAAGGTRLTETGLSLGTPQYMSPEQATGDRALDGRSDIYSLACVLYEMLAGDPPHTGSTVQAVIAKVVTDRPRDITELRGTVPPHVAATLQKALAKLPADRFASARTFGDALALSGTATVERRGVRHRSAGIAMVLSAAVGALATWALMTVKGGPGTEGTFRPVERPLTFSGVAEAVGLSPDGQTVAYMTPAGLVSRDVRGGRETLVLGGREGGTGIPLKGDARWLPDGSGLAFAQALAGRETGVFTVPRLGGDPIPRLITTFAAGQPGGGVLYFPDGERALMVRALEQEEAAPWLIVYGSGDSLGIDVDPSALRLWDATISPNGQWIAYVAERSDRSVFIGTVRADGTLGEIVVEGGQELSKWGETSAHPRWPGNRIIAWVAQDRVYFRVLSGRGMDLFVVQVDPRNGRRRAEPRVVTRGLPRGASFDISGDGSRLVYSGGLNRAHVHLMRLAGAPGTFEVSDSIMTQGTGWNTSPRISRDGRRLAFVARTFGTADFQWSDLSDRGFRRLSALTDWRTVQDFVLSPDATRLLAQVDGESADRLLVIDVPDGRAQEIASVPTVNVQIGWSPDGGYVLYGGSDASHYLVRNLEDGTERRLFEEIKGEFIFAMFSPDSRSVLVQDITTNLLWIAPVEGGDARSPGRVYEGLATPMTARAVHWAEDDMIWIFDPTERTLSFLPAAGGTPRRVAQLPVSCIHLGGVSVAADARTFVCSAAERESDIWVIDDFDPEVATRSRDSR